MEILGEMALFDNDAPKKRVASVRAMEDSQLLVIVDYAIVELGKKHPVVYEKIADVIRKRSAENNKKNS